jgi:hypothetical protein
MMVARGGTTRPRWVSAQPTGRAPRAPLASAHDDCRDSGRLTPCTGALDATR